MEIGSKGHPMIPRSDGNGVNKGKTNNSLLKYLTSTRPISLYCSEVMFASFREKLCTQQAAPGWKSPEKHTHDGGSARRTFMSTEDAD